LSTLSPWRLGLSTFAALVPDQVASQLVDIGIANLSGLGSALFTTGNNARPAQT